MVIIFNKKQSNVFLFQNSSHLLNHINDFSISLAQCKFPNFSENYTKNKNKNLGWRSDGIGLGLGRGEAAHMKVLSISLEWNFNQPGLQMKANHALSSPFLSAIKLVVQEWRGDELRAGERQLPGPYSHSFPPLFHFSCMQPMRKSHLEKK